MAIHEFEYETNVEVDVAVEVTVSSSNGDDIDFEMNGIGDHIDITIDMEGLKEIIKEELYVDIRKEIIEEIGKGANPFSMLVAFLSCVGEVYERTQQEVRENRRGEIDHFQKEIALLMKDKATLKEHNAMLREQLSPKEESNGN